MSVQTDFIKKNLSTFPSEFVDCVIRTFIRVKNVRGYGEALPASVMIYAAAKKYNLPAKICVGLLNVQGRDIYSAWCKVGDTIIDPAVFGLTNYYKDFLSDNLMSSGEMEFTPMPVPFIGTEETAPLQNLSYQENIFDEDWDRSYLKAVYGLPVYAYIASAPDNGMMRGIADILGKRYSEKLANDVYDLLGLDRIGVQTKEKGE